jgi:hypothetical protein
LCEELLARRGREALVHRQDGITIVEGPSQGVDEPGSTG